METIQAGTIEGKRINGRYGSWKHLRAEREKGCSDVELTFPAGPRTDKKITMVVNDEQFIQLAMWMRGERR